MKKHFLSASYLACCCLALSSVGCVQRVPLPERRETFDPKPEVAVSPKDKINSNNAPDEVTDAIPDADPSDQKSGLDTAFLQDALTKAQKLAIADQLFLYEGGGLRVNLVAWNSGENFPSLGIAHFIWMPAAAVAEKARFGESFPRMLRFLVNHKVRLIPFLAKLSPSFTCPWTQKSDIASIEAEELRTFLDENRDYQVDYAIHNFVSLSQEILLSAPTLRDQVLSRMKSVAKSRTGVYPLIDYINFKGSGLGNQTWGLKQVLLEMKGDGPEEFGAAADRILTQRTENFPDDRKFLVGWRQRVRSYSQFSMPGR